MKCLSCCFYASLKKQCVTNEGQLVAITSSKGLFFKSNVQVVNFLQLGNSSWGAFNNYVDKMRGEVGQKMSVFVHA